jgi:endonuclease/exonuclease/phosphatase family metal-dependent hydrolase
MCAAVARFFSRINLKWHLAFGVLLLAGSSLAQNFSLESAWSLSPGERPYLTSGSSLERGLAYNPVTDHLLVVSRVDSPTIRRIAVLSAADGADVGELSSSGISGGTIVLSKMGVADDGVIYAANFGTYTGSKPFKVYRWANESAAPTLAFSGDPGLGNNQQWGNALDVRGTGENTQILLATRGTIIAILTTTNGTNFTSRVLNTDAPAGAFYHGIAFGPGNTFWGQTNSGPLREMRFDLIAGTATTLRTISPPDFPAAFSPIAVDPVNRLLAGVTVGNPDTLTLYDISHPTNPPALLGTTNWPTDYSNPLFQGALDFYPGGKLFALNVNNGLSAFHIVPPSRLAVTASGGNVTLAWAQRFSSAVLQTRSSLAGGAWSNSGLTPVAQAGAWRVTPPQTNGAEFYRLQRTVRVMSYNIQHGEGAEGLIDLPRIAAVITNAGADIVGLQEVDQKTTRSSGVDQAAELGRLTGMNYYFGRSINYQGGGYGNAVLSRFPIRQQKQTLLAKLDLAVEQRGVNEVVIDLGGAELVLLNTHLDAGASHDERVHSVAQLKTISQSYGARAVLLCGDLNTRPTEPAYAALAADFVDAWLVVGLGNGYTFPSGTPNRRIDYFWHPPGRHVPLRASIPATTASDHRPLVMEWLVPVP